MSGGGYIFFKDRIRFYRFLVGKNIYKILYGFSIKVGSLICFSLNHSLSN